MLAADSIRACRLVVDTGVHAAGLEPVPGDRVHGRPHARVGGGGHGGGLGTSACPVTKDDELGQREIFARRASARARLGAGFDIKGFHDAVLGSGSVSLPVLGDLADTWVAASGR